MMCNLIFLVSTLQGWVKNKRFIIKLFIIHINQLESYFHIFQWIPHFSKLHSLHSITTWHTFLLQNCQTVNALSLGCHSAMITVQSSRDVTNHRQHFNTSLEDSCPELNSILHLQYLGPVSFMFPTPNGLYFALFSFSKETR